MPEGNNRTQGENDGMNKAGAARAIVRAVLVAPFTGRARREALFALGGIPIGFGFLGIAFGGALAVATAAGPTPDSAAWTVIWAPTLVLALLVLRRFRHLVVLVVVSELVITGVTVGLIPNRPRPFGVEMRTSWGG